MGTQERYRAFVAGYLVSPRGIDTPDSVASALLELDPDVCGFTRRPSADRLHVWRGLIEDVHANPENEPAETAQICAVTADILGAG